MIHKRTCESQPFRPSASKRGVLISCNLAEDGRHMHTSARAPPR